MAANSTLRSIGQVLASLKSEFPDVSISKIRFLESVGLLAPERAPSGYRRYRPADVDRLRYILRIQKSQYLPLKVIKDHLDQLDRGLEPPRLAPAQANLPKSNPKANPNPKSNPNPNGNHNGSVRRRPGESAEQEANGSAETAPGRTAEGQSAPVVGGAAAGNAANGQTRQPPKQLRLSRADLLEASGLTDSALAELESIQVIVPRRGTHYYGREALAIAVAARRLAVYGIDSRHLRAFKLAADREIGLVEQAIAPHTRARGTDGRGDVAAEVTQLVIGVHAALIRTGMDR